MKNLQLTRQLHYKLFNLLLSVILSGSWLFVLTAKAAPIAILSVHKDSDGLTLKMKEGTLKLEVFSSRIIRVVYGLGETLPPTKSFAIIGKPVHVRWKVNETDNEVCLRTDELEARVNRVTGVVEFYDKSEKPLLIEKADGGKSLTPNVVGGINALRSLQGFALAPEEAIYGLGQHQEGLMNYCGSTIHLQQKNPGESAVPVLVSSRGYGVLWDNPAVTDVSVGAGNEEIIPSVQLYTEDGQPGGLTARYYRGENFDTLVDTRTNTQIDFNWNIKPPTDLPHDHYSVRWTGFIEAKLAGTYTLLASSDDGVRLWIDDKLVINAWNTRPVQIDVAKVEFAAHSRHRIRMEYYQAMEDAVVRLAWRPPMKANTVTWTSEAADTIDYYFMYGPELDKVIADYRDLTGAAPMFGKWAWGFWQSKEHYATQQELANVVNQYRASNIPIDCIIQDWYYWNPNPWGSHQFNTANYPNVTQLMQMLHNAHAHMIISVWGRFDVGSYSNYIQLNNTGALYSQVIGNEYRYYDAFNPTGRQLYWQQISNELFSLGIDGWWLDSSEPELGGNWGIYTNYTTAAGSGAKVFNAYPLMHTAGVYQGQRASGSNKRVFILTRSAYAGQQRNAAVTWSGDIQPIWQVFKAQIPAGINFSMSGIPYWNTDIGGFTAADPADPAYDELFTRWFQFGAFCPMFRVHGETSGNVGKEMWQFPAATERILINYDQLRYHLLPYIYSVSWMVTSQSYSMMRGLMMDFRQDTNVYNIPDQYMFGPALMVNPVMQAGATNRNVYLPAGTTWWDFWTGRSYVGGQTNNAAAPIEMMPLFVRAGSIIPYGPSIQYAMESADPVELRVYRGADGNFTLYEDEGDNYNYEKGNYATIPISWKEATQMLTIGERHGSFRGMLKERTFRVVWVSPDHGTGIPSMANADVIVHYTGKAVKISGGK